MAFISLKFISNSFKFFTVYYLKKTKNKICEQIVWLILNIFCLDEPVGFVIPVADRQGIFLIGLGTTLASLQWNLNEKTHKVHKLITVDKDKPGNRWNDGKADNNGYLWAGKYLRTFTYV